MLAAFEADLLEDRRRRALALVDSGCSLNEAVRRIGCGASSVMREVIEVGECLGVCILEQGDMGRTVVAITKMS